MRFGSVDLFMDFSDWGSRMGRPIANEEFLKALLTYSSYDSFHFFCPDSYHMESFRTRIDEMIIEPHLRSRVETTLQIALSETIAHEDFHVFHLGDFTYFMPFLAGIRNRFARRHFPITGVTHSLDGVFMNLRYLELFLSGLTPFDGIICTSLAAQKAVEKGLSWMHEKIMERTGADLGSRVSLKCIPLGIEERYFQDEDKKEARAFFHIPSDQVIALSVGRLSLRHKADWSPVLELLSRMYLSGDIENMLLIIAGGGTDAEIAFLESMISRLGLQQKVLLFPNFSPEVKTKLYRAADFYISIVDNFQETFGLTVIEAMASRLPVIISDFSGYRELVTEGKNGFLIPTTWSQELPEFLLQNLGILNPSVARLYFAQTVAVDLQSLRKSIINLYSNRQLREKMGEKAKSEASFYRWPNIITAYESFWADLNKETQGRSTHTVKTPDLLIGDHATTFSHYPSRSLSEHDTLHLTETGRQMLNSPEIITRYEDVQTFIFQELEHFIIEILEDSPKTVEILRRLSAEALSATTGQVDTHLLWLLKHGALTLDQPEGENVNHIDD